ncbi:acyl-CoA thioesterase/BAAT N-terminal domain-containing protein [Kribbella sp. GL6]|uniref:acyl-CoA thioesterase/BAAT N-terminal domain-containing protein n=1 Tax=Kribbella sp. GL6 TaxID=3419765 RepID=UPI003D00F8BD
MNRSIPLLAGVCLLMAACSSPGRPAVTVDQAVTLADQPVQLKVTGVPAGKPVQVGADAVAWDGKKWHSEATFTADDHGTIDLGRAKPSGGSYQDVDGMGLFWSMNPPDGDPDEQSFVPPAEGGWPVEHVDLSVRSGGKQVARTTITRRWAAPGISSRPLPHQFTGTYVVPKRDGARHPAVLLLGGSEGGVPPLSVAELLASHGYPVVALAYFRAPGRPQDLHDIPIEYFAQAAKWLGAQPEADPARIVAMGTSYGSQPALLVADLFPTVVHGAVLFAPGDRIIRAFPLATGAAWTFRGRPLAPDGEIPVDAVDGPVLAVAGYVDAQWESRLSALSIMRRLDAAHDKYPHEAVVVDGAGHGVGGTPYVPHGTRFRHPIIGLTDFGGSRAADDSAIRQGWAKTLALLAAL